LRQSKTSRKIIRNCQCEQCNIFM